MFEFTVFATTSWIIALIVIFLSMAIFLGSRDYSARVFSVLIFIVALWITSSGLFYSSNTENLAAFFMRTDYFLGSLTGIGFYYFCLSYPENKKPSVVFKIASVSIVSFSIMKHGQMNVRAVYTELLIFAATLLLFASIFI